MKKFISALLAGVMLIGGASSLIAADASPAASTPEIKDGALLRIDEKSGRLVLLDGPITVAKLKGGFTSDITVADRSGKAKSDADPVASEDVVTAGDTSLTTLLYGDVNRDGAIDLSDTVLTLRAVAGQNVDIDTLAADVDASGNVDTADAVKLLRKVAGWAVSLGNLRWVAANEPKKAANEDASLDLYFENPLRKIARSDTASTGKYTYKMSLARNESESAQMFLATDKNYEGLSVEMSDWEYEFGGNDGVVTGEVLWEYYYDLTYVENVLWKKKRDEQIYYYDYFAEALPPMADSFELIGGRSQGFMINITASKDAPAGMYRATVDVKNASGQVIKSAYVYAYVWDFTLPDTPYSKSAFNIGRNELYRKTGNAYEVDSYITYYEFLLDNNLSAYNMPYRANNDEADAYMSDPRVTSFVIAGMQEKYAGEMWMPDNEVVAAYQKVKSNEEWAKKGYFYYQDEPYGDGVYFVKSDYERLASLLGTEDFRFILPFGNMLLDHETGLDAFEFYKPYVSIWVPTTNAYLPFMEYGYGYRWLPRRTYEVTGKEAYERFYELREEDPKNELWWYVCVTPEFPWPNYFNVYSGLINRVVLWQQYMVDVEGILYYLVNAWGGVSKNQTESDGLLIYWGELFGFENTPVLSYRMVQIRDSFDDFDYMKMIEERYDRETALEIVHRVTTGMLTVNEDPDNMIAAREALGALLEGTDK